MLTGAVAYRFGLQFKRLSSSLRVEEREGETRIIVSAREKEEERRVILGPHVMMKWKNKNTYRWGTGSLRIHSLSIPPHPLTLVLM